jgi:hypothetical protein
MRKDQKLHGASLKAAAVSKAKRTGYDVVIAWRQKAMRISPDGSTSLGRVGDFGYCVNFGPGSV